MNDLNCPADLFKFQLNRQIICFAKTILDILEKNKEYVLELEKLNLQLGITSQRNIGNDYRLDRKLVLDKSNEIIRELSFLLDKLDINFKI